MFIHRASPQDPSQGRPAEEDISRKICVELFSSLARHGLCYSLNTAWWLPAAAAAALVTQTMVYVVTVTT